MNDTVRALAVLEGMVRRTLADHGLELRHVAFIPDPDGEHLFFNVYAGLAPEAPAPPADDGFDDVIRSTRAAEHEQRTRASIDDLTRRLNEGGGFLDF